MKIGVLMDPIAQIKPYKDTSFALMLEAQARGHSLYYLESEEIWLQDGLIWGNMQGIQVYDDPRHWFDYTQLYTQPLTELDLVLMRKDPPFNMQYIYLTYLLEQAENKGLVVLNKPQSLRDANEKLFTSWFAHCCPKTLVTSQKKLLKEFVAHEKSVIIKPLDGMGGSSIFRINQGDPNTNVILETMTHHNTLVMAQKFIPAIAQGDKRIIMIHGEPIPYALARIPAADDFRGNFASGATPRVQELTERDQWICEEVGPVLREKGLAFVGLDIIGDYLTEINVTSPTGVRELEAAVDINICADFFNIIERDFMTC